MPDTLGVCRTIYKVKKTYSRGIHGFLHRILGLEWDCLLGEAALENCETHYSRERLQFSNMLMQVQETQCQGANLKKQVLTGQHF